MRNGRSAAWLVLVTIAACGGVGNPGADAWPPTAPTLDMAPRSSGAVAVGAQQPLGESVSTRERNAWPFPGFSDDEVRNYIDERATSLAINLLSGRAILTLDTESVVEFPLSWLDLEAREVLPILPVQASREDALNKEQSFQPYREQRGLIPVLFYRDATGLIWPTRFNSQTVPRIMSVYPPAFEVARAGVTTTQNAFVELAFWYIGVRLGGGIRATFGTQTGRLSIASGRTLSTDEMAVASKLVREGRAVKALPVSLQHGVRTADFIVDGAKTELKTVSNLTSRDLSGALGRRILEGAGQAPHIIADVRQQAGITRELAERAIRRAFGADTARRIQKIRIIGKGFDMTVPRVP